MQGLVASIFGVYPLLFPEALDRLQATAITDCVDEVLATLKGKQINAEVIQKAAVMVKKSVEKLGNHGGLTARRQVKVLYRGIPVDMHVKSTHQEFEYKLSAMIKELF